MRSKIFCIIILFIFYKLAILEFENFGVSQSRVNMKQSTDKKNFSSSIAGKSFKNSFKGQLAIGVFFINFLFLHFFR